MCLLLILSSGVNAKNISSFDAHEDELTSCLKKGEESEKCLTHLISDYFPNDVKNALGKTKSVVNVFTEWSNSRTVFAVYKLAEKRSGDYQLKKSFIVENDKAKIILAEIVYRKRLGEWHVTNFSFVGSKEKIQKILDAE